MFKVLWLVLLSIPVWANTYRIEIYGSSTYEKPNDSSAFNPDNRVLGIPTWAHVLELRPDLQFDLNEEHALIVRSRHFLSDIQRDFDNPDQSRTSILSDSDLSDLFFSSNWNESFQTAVGLQNYQWGPAEIFSPTNPFFHFNNEQRSFFYKEKGRVMARVNWNPDPLSSRWSIVGLYEPINNNERYWTADREFKPKSALKIEYQFTNPINTVALVVGQGEQERGFFGEYFTWSPVEGTSIYGDIQHHPGRTNYAPERNGLGFYDLVGSVNDEKIYTFAILGIRWEGRVDFRQEFIWNEAGYDSTEWRRAKESALIISPNIFQNIRRFSSPGLEFRTQSYSYTSLRIPDIGKNQKSAAAVRWLSSMTENSSALQLNWEYLWSDRTVLQAEVLEFLGEQGSEFRLVSDTQAALGFRWSY